MKFLIFLLPAVVFGQNWTSQAHWQMQASGTTASLRGVSAVSEQEVWASGTGGTWLRTTDGGATWKSGVVAGAEKLDFRGVVGFRGGAAVLMSIGAGENSRVYKTTDAGAHWSLLFTNPDAKGFFDAIAFSDEKRGMIAGDVVDGQMTIFTTDDGGAHWAKQKTVPAAEGEGAFAASNTCLIVKGANAVLGTGAGRILKSNDYGRTWNAVSTPIRHDKSSAGIFSVAVSDGVHGMAVGGDYASDKEARDNIAVTDDAGQTWSAPAAGPAGFRSAVVYVPARNAWIVTGTSGSDITEDGKSWRHFDDGSFNALAWFGGNVWAVGAKGRVASLQPNR